MNKVEINKSASNLKNYIHSNIVQYTEHEKDNFKNGRVRIVNEESDITDFIQKSIKSSSNFKLYFGKLGIEIASKIKLKIGIDVLNYNISLQTNAVKHILKNHGNCNLEIMRGQVAINANDFKIIPRVILNYDKLQKTGVVENNNLAIIFKKLDIYNYFLVCYISNKNHNLEVKTMWKKASKKNSATASDTKKSRS